MTNQTKHAIFNIITHHQYTLKLFRPISVIIPLKNNLQLLPARKLLSCFGKEVWIDLHLLVCDFHVDKCAALWLAVCVRNRPIDRDLIEICRDFIEIGRDIISTNYITENWSQSKLNALRCDAIIDNNILINWLRSNWISRFAFLVNHIQRNWSRSKYNWSQYNSNQSHYREFVAILLFIHRN